MGECFGGGDLRLVRHAVEQSEERCDAALLQDRLLDGHVGRKREVRAWPEQRGARVSMQYSEGSSAVISGHQRSSDMSSGVITWPEKLGEGVGSRLLRLASLEHLEQEWDGARRMHGRLRLHIRRRHVRHAVGR